MQILATLTYQARTRRFNPYHWQDAIAKAGKPTSEIEADAFWRQLHRERFARSIAVEVSDHAPVSELFELIAEKYELEFVPRGRSNFPHRRFGRNDPEDDRLFAFQRSGFVEAGLIHYPNNERIYTYPPDYFGTRENDPGHDALLSDLGIQDGDVVEALCMSAWSDSGAYLMAPVRDFEEFENRVAENAVKLPYALDQPYIYGALLYTDEDAELATYVRKFFASLSELSGQYFKIYVVERSSFAADLQYWRGRLTNEALQIMGVTGLLDYVPYDRSNSYRIAAELGVDPAKLPCLVLFDYVRREDKLVFPISQASPGFFRTLFGRLERVVSSGRGEVPMPPDQYGTRPSAFYRLQADGGVEYLQSADAFASVSRSYAEILRDLEPTSAAPASAYSFHGYTVFISSQSGAKVSENYTFNADTTFINRPSHTIIQDFNNKYLSSANGDTTAMLTQIGKLVELIAVSTDVSQRDRSDSLRALDTMADEVRDGRADRVSVRGRLQVIREIAQKAADISVPAMATIGALLKAFGIS